MTVDNLQRGGRGRSEPLEELAADGTRQTDERQSSVKENMNRSSADFSKSLQQWDFILVLPERNIPPPHQLQEP